MLVGFLSFSIFCNNFIKYRLLLLQNLAELACKTSRVGKKNKSKKTNKACFPFTSEVPTQGTSCGKWTSVNKYLKHLAPGSQGTDNNPPQLWGWDEDSAQARRHSPYSWPKPWKWEKTLTVILHSYFPEAERSVVFGPKIHHFYHLCIPLYLLGTYFGQDTVDSIMTHPPPTPQGAPSVSWRTNGSHRNTETFFPLTPGFVFDFSKKNPGSKNQDYCARYAKRKERARREYTERVLGVK